MSKVKRIQPKIAKKGDIISFERRDKTHVGYVFKVNENSVLVQVSTDTQLYLGYENANTIVAHRSYLILPNPLRANE